MVRSLIKDLVIRLNSSLQRRLLPCYPFHHQPAHLAYLVHCLDRTRALQGPVVEVGCAEGWTAVFLNTHLDSSGIEKVYYCVDTFSGFCEEDIEYEKKVRRKGPSFPSAAFRTNRKAWFDRTMEVNGITRVRSIQADVKEVDFNGITDVSFCLIDLDLYLPVKAALEKVYPLMAQGSVLIVDDCSPGGYFDGAFQAYSEFVSKHGLRENIVLEKFGVIEIGTGRHEG